MLTLQQGDRLPSVAIAQMFLNQFGSVSLAVDGIYGRNTNQAVSAYQTAHGIRPTGIINGRTFLSLNRNRWQVMNSVDAVDDSTAEHVDLINAGGEAFPNYGMSNGAMTVLQRVQSRANSGRVAMLRFHGHGSPGYQGLATGVIDAGSALSSGYGSGFFEYLKRLRPIFSSFGCVELHGCRVGQGRSGYNLLRGLSDAMNVPVTAGVVSQWGGGDSTFRFEGRVRTLFPGVHNLRSWAEARCNIRTCTMVNRSF